MLPDRKYAAIIAIVFSVFWGEFMTAQTGPGPFSTISAGVGYSPPMLHYDLDGAWEAGEGYQINFASPFYWGVAGAAVRVTKFRGKSSQFPDYLMTELLLHWGPEIAISKAVRLLPAVHGGLSYWRFDENQVYAGSGNVWESEFQSGGSLALKFALSKKWRAEAGIRRAVIFTRQPIWFTVAHLSLQYELITPGWMRRFLN